MTTSYTFSESTAFTVTHARHIAAKVATDLKRIQRFYGYPSDSAIADYETELIALLKAGYLAKVSYGFRRDGEFIEPTLIYAARDLAGFSADDDDPGKVSPGADITGAAFYSHLTYTTAWAILSPEEKAAFKATLPFSRGSAPEPTISGYVRSDRTYSAGSRALERESVRALG